MAITVVALNSNTKVIIVNEQGEILEVETSGDIKTMQEDGNIAGQAIPKSVVKVCSASGTSSYLQKCPIKAGIIVNDF